MKTTVDGLDEAIRAELDAFQGVCVEDIQEAANAAAKYAAKELKAKSPKVSGDYAKGWTSTMKKTRTGAVATVYNKDRYMLAHLLEYGHAKTNGGRTKAMMHITPIESAAVTRFEDEIKGRIENGT